MPSADIYISKDEKIVINRRWLAGLSKAIKLNDKEKLDLFANHIDLLVENKELEIKLNIENGSLNKSLIID